MHREKLEAHEADRQRLAQPHSQYPVGGAGPGSYGVAGPPSLLPPNTASYDFQSRISVGMPHWTHGPLQHQGGYEYI